MNRKRYPMKAACSWLLALLLFSNLVQAQPANTYTFTTGTGVSLETLSAPVVLVGSGVDDTPASAASAIGFSFTINSNNYSNFWVNANGLFGFGTSPSTSYSNSITAPPSFPALMPWWDDMGTGTNGNVQYQLLGTSPNRKLVVEWRVRNIGETGNYTKTYQLWLFESNFAIQFVYGTGTAGSSASIGMSTSATEYQSVTTTSNTASTTTPANTQSTFPASGRYYLFTPASCAGTPSPGNTLASANPVCSGSALTLSMSTPPSSIGITYRWQTSPDGSTWTNVAGAAGNNVTLSANPTVATYYRCRVTCSASGLNGFSTPLLVNVVNCYNMQNGSLSNVCSARFYDSGGLAAAYANAESYTLTIYPTPGNLLRVQFNSFVTESGYDYLSIYNGNSTAAPLLLNTSGSTVPGTYTSSAVDGSLTFRFTSDLSITYAGWDALLSCVSLPVCSGTPTAGTISGTSGLCAGGTTTLTASGFSSGVSGLSFQWEESDDNGVADPWANVVGGSGANTNSYTSPALSVSRYYRMRVTCSNGGGTATTSGYLVTANPLPIVAIAANPGTTICGPGAINLSASGADTYNWSPASGLNATTGASVTATLSSSTSYTVVGTITATGCTATQSVSLNLLPGYSVNATANPVNICSGGSAQLNAVAQMPSSSYLLNPISPALVSTAGFATGPASDDAIVGPITLPFNFNFFGSSEDSLYISSNGHIIFGNSAPANQLAGLNIPDATDPDNVIALCWADLNPGSSGSVTYGTVGTAPNRIFVISWNAVPFYLQSGSNVTGQIQLYEGSNVVEVHISVINRGASTSNTVLGIENATGSSGLAPASRNGGTWSVSSPEAWRFSPYVPSYTYAWTPSTGLDNPAIPMPVASGVPGTTVYTVTVTADGVCTATATALVNEGVALSATASALPASVCEGQSTQLSGAASGGGEPFAYSWSDGVTEIGTTQLLTITPPVGSSTYYLTVTDACGGSTSTTVVVTALPGPVLALQPVSAVYCGTPLALTASSGGGTTFGWSPATGLNATTGSSVSASPATATTYTVTATATNGCTISGTIPITIGTPLTVSVGADTTQGCAPFGSVLRACVNPTFNTYTLDSAATDYSPVGSTAFIALSSADDGDAAVNLPFPFNFYGVNYTSIRVGSNGYIGMGTTPVTSLANQALPSATAPNGIIALCWDDLLHSGLATGIDTFTVGTAPNRKFVVRYNAGAVAFYNIGSQTGSLGGKIVLHEGTGVIEVRIDVMNKGVRIDNQTLGIEDAAGLAAVTPPGKNNLDWLQSTPVTYRFTPAAQQCNNAGISFDWTPAATLHATNLDTAVITGLNSTTIFTVTASNASGCSAQDTVQIFVSPQAPTPVISSSGPLSFCPGGSVTLSSSSTAFPNYWSTGETTNSITVNTTQTVSVYSSDAFCPSGRAYVDVVRFDTVPPLINVSGGGLALCSGNRDLLSDGAPLFVAWSWSTSETSQQITIMNPGTYAVAATDTNGCVTHAEITFTAGVAPVAPVISTLSSLSVCNNEYVTIDSDIPDGLTWFPTFDNTPSIAYNLSPPGVYDFYVSRDSLGCTSESNHLVFTVNPTPEVYFFLPADSACVGDVITLNGSGLSNVSSISFNGTPVSVFSVLDDYTIQVTVPVGATSGGITLTDGSTGCAGVSPLFSIKEVCGVSVNLKVWLQGYCLPTPFGGSMMPVWTQQMRSDLGNGNPGSPAGTETDLVYVGLYDDNHVLQFEDSVMIMTDGTGRIDLPAAFNGNSYYLLIKHRSHVAIRSAGLVLMSPVVTYDFTLSESQADNNGSNFGMTQLSNGKWAMWVGDVTQDGFVGGDDVGSVDNDNLLGIYLEYRNSDVTGDGFVGGDDVGAVDNNNLLGVYYFYP